MFDVSAVPAASAVPVCDVLVTASAVADCAVLADSAVGADCAALESEPGCEAWALLVLLLFLPEDSAVASAVLAL